MTNDKNEYFRSEQNKETTREREKKTSNSRVMRVKHVEFQGRF